MSIKCKNLNWKIIKIKISFAKEAHEQITYIQDNNKTVQSHKSLIEHTDKLNKSITIKNIFSGLI